MWRAADVRKLRRAGEHGGWPKMRPAWLARGRPGMAATLRIRLHGCWVGGPSRGTLESRNERRFD